MGKSKGSGGEARAQPPAFALTSGLLQEDDAAKAKGGRCPGGPVGAGP